MRDYFFLTVLYSSLPICFLRPYVGILMWAWISLMNPHRFMWDPQGIQPVLLVAVATLAGCLFTRDKKPPPLERETLLLFLLLACFTITTLYASVPDFAWTQWRRTSKALLMSFATLLLSQGRTRLRLFLLVISLSVGYFGFRGGLDGLRGDYGIVWGPEYSFIADNNMLAMAELMILPLLICMAKETRHLVIKAGLYSLVFLVGISVILSYSRAAFVGLLGLVFLLWLRSEKKIPAAALILLTALGASQFIPDAWFERIRTIGNYQDDWSAYSRVRGATAAWNVAVHHPWTGTGFGAHQTALYTEYFPPVWCRRHQQLEYLEVHTAPLQLLADHGFITFGVFSALVASCFWSLRRLRRDAQAPAGPSWIAAYASALEASLAVYLITSAFHPSAYFELLYYIVPAVILLKAASKEEYAKTEEEQSRPPTADTALFGDGFPQSLSRIVSQVKQEP